MSHRLSNITVKEPQRISIHRDLHKLAPRWVIKRTTCPQVSSSSMCRPQLTTLLQILLSQTPSVSSSSSSLTETTLLLDLPEVTTVTELTSPWSPRTIRTSSCPPTTTTMCSNRTAVPFSRAPPHKAHCLHPNNIPNLTHQVQVGLLINRSRALQVKWRRTVRSTS